MNNYKQLIISVVLSVLATYALVQGSVSHVSAPKESVYERVMRTGTLRCGFFPEAPFTIIDPNTGKHTGIAVDLAEKMAAEFGWKVEWVSAENFGTLTEDLRNGRYDAICASVFNLPRAGRIDYTIPYAYAPVYGYMRSDRHDFDNKLDTLDWSKVSVAGLDGEGATTIARKKIANAKFVILPESSPVADMLTAVADKKADISFLTPTVFTKFDQNSPNILHRVVTDHPFYVFNVSFAVKPDKAALKNLLDYMIRNMSENGTLQDLYKKYDPDGLLFMPKSMRDAAKN